MLNEKFKELSDKICQLYRSDKDACMYQFSVSDEEKQLLIKACKKHRNDHKKVYEDTSDWMEFIDGMIKTVKISKDTIEFNCYQFVKLLGWVIDLKYI